MKREDYERIKETWKDEGVISLADINILFDFVDMNSSYGCFEDE